MRRLAVVLLLSPLMAACGSADEQPALSGLVTTTIPPIEVPDDLPAIGLAMAPEDHEGVVLLDLDGTVLAEVEDVWVNANEAVLIRRDDGATLDLGRTGEAEPDLPPANDDGGHWAHAWPEPGGDRVLAQWSGECESPTAYVIEADATMHPVRTTSDGDQVESFAFGWAPDGRAVVSFTEGLCGSGEPSPGTYLVDLDDPAAPMDPITPLVYGGMWER